MGRLLGSHSTDELDRPDLNRCPECGSYFAPTTEYCPICSAYCPEEYRAGNRKPVKAKRQNFSRASSRVVFVEWYHSWWFIALALLSCSYTDLDSAVENTAGRSIPEIFASDGEAAFRKMESETLLTIIHGQSEKISTVSSTSSAAPASSVASAYSVRPAPAPFSVAAPLVPALKPAPAYSAPPCQGLPAAPNN